MNKTLLAVALFAGSASAAVINPDQFSVNGRFAVGGFSDSAAEREVFNGGVTGADLFVNYENNNIVGKFGSEFNIEDDYGVTDSTFKTTDLWVGYKTPVGVASIGYINDTALDAVDGAASQAIEFLSSPADASDANMIVKLEGGESGLTYGISYYLDRNQQKNSNPNLEKQSGFNGYVGYATPVFSINAGYEQNDDGIEGADRDGAIDNLYLVNATVALGKIDLGATYSESETIGGTTQALYNASAGMQFGKLYLGGGYVNVEDTREAANFGGTYAFTDNVDLLVDVAYHLDDLAGHESGDVETFTMLAYHF